MTKSNSGDSLFTEENKCSCRGYNLDKLLQPILLGLLAEQELHGYRIIQEMLERKLYQGQNPDTTGIYRSLRSLEERGLVISAWDTSGSGTAKKIYRITEAGRECLDNWVATLQGYKTLIEAVINQAASAR